MLVKGYYSSRKIHFPSLVSDSENIFRLRNSKSENIFLVRKYKS